jgi:hypothetical protein
LSLILCSRNDEYMGNSRWRLETTLNYLAARVHELGRDGVEVIVADWGSDVPLREVLRLSPEAAAIVSFLLVPPTLATQLQGDSPFPEVLALNAAARRARGEYIGRIDQDTLVSSRFLEVFDRLYTGEQLLPVPMESALLFSQRRDIPYAFASRSPSLWTVTQFLRWFKALLPVEPGGDLPWYATSVGIWLLHRDLWHECSGYDERMIYMNRMECNMIDRLELNHELVDLGALIDEDLHHLNHPPWDPRKSPRRRKVNPKLQFEDPECVDPNGAGWGLLAYDLPVVPAHESTDGREGSASIRADLREFVRLVGITAATSFWYALIKPLHPRRWDSARGVVLRRRLVTARQTISGHPPRRWPSLLRTRWNKRLSKPAKQP